MNPLRRHYLAIARDRIDEQIAELKERRADLAVEIIRMDRTIADIKALVALLAPEEKVTRSEALEWWERARESRKHTGGMANEDRS